MKSQIQLREKTTEYMDTQKNTVIQNTDNPHDKGYKRIFSIKKNFLLSVYHGNLA